MNTINWKKLLSRSVEDADIISKIPKHQKHIDDLLDYDGRISIDGEAYTTDVLKLLYMEALDNVCSSAVLDLLSSIDGSDAREGLVNDVFLDLAIEQHKKTRFLSELKKFTSSEAQSCDGQIKPEKLSLYAVEDALASMGLEIKLNLVTKRIEVSGYGSEALYELYSRSNILNVLPLLLRDHLKSEGVTGLGQGTKLIEQYLLIIADQNRYNPIHEMFEEYENDDEGTVAVLCAMLGIYDEFDMLLVKKWLIQCVALAYNNLEKPVSAEGVLVLQGPQGCGKTSFFRRLAIRPEWFTEGAVIDVRNKDSVISSLSTWICELGEIDCTLKREQSALKAFITRPLDRIRFPYAAAESELPRITSLCGTVNPDKFLNDLTGARRYWVVKVENIVKDKLFTMPDEEIMELWGYVYHAYKENPEGFRLTDEERKKLESRNRAHNCELKYEAEVLELLDFSLPVEYWSEVKPARLAGFMGSTNASQVGKILSKLADEDERIKKNKSNRCNSYTIPLKEGIVRTFRNINSGR